MAFERAMVSLRERRRKGWRPHRPSLPFPPALPSQSLPLGTTASLSIPDAKWGTPQKLKTAVATLFPDKAATPVKPDKMEQQPLFRQAAGRAPWHSVTSPSPRDSLPLSSG